MQVQHVPLSHYLREHPYLRQWLIIGAVLGLFGAIVIYDLVHERTALLDGARERLQASARIVDDNLSAQLETANTILTDVARDIPVWGRETNGNAGAIRRLDAMARALPGIRSVSIVDAYGIVRASNLPELIGRDLSGRDYFAVARHAANPGLLHVSPPFLAVTGKYIIALTHSYADTDGNFAGIVVASLDLSYFNTLLRSVLHAPDMWSAVLHQDGQMFALVSNTALGAAPPHDPLIQQHLDSDLPMSVQIGYSPISDDTRIVALRTIRPPQLQMDKGLVIAISRNRSAVLADWYELAFVLGGAMVAVFALGIGLQRFHQRSLQRYEQEMRESARAARGAEQRFASAFNDAPIGMLMRDADGRILRVNKALCDMLGYAETDIIEIGLPALMEAPYRGAESALLQELLAGRRRDYRMELALRHRDGHAIWIQLSVAGVFDAQGRLEYLIKHLLDITVQREQSVALENLAHYDILTRLPNRALLEDRMRQSIAHARRNGSSLAVCFIDLDRFKPVNDQHGHDAGDLVLIQVAQRMQQQLRADDTLARLGGDEFVALLPNLRDSGEVNEVIPRLLAAIEEPITLGNGVTVGVSASFGSCFYPQDGDTPDDLLRYADRAMYMAKYSGSVHQRYSGNLAIVPKHERGVARDAEGG